MCAPLHTRSRDPVRIAPQSPPRPRAHRSVVASETPCASLRTRLPCPVRIAPHSSPLPRVHRSALVSPAPCTSLRTRHTPCPTPSTHFYVHGPGVPVLSVGPRRTVAFTGPSLRLRMWVHNDSQQDYRPNIVAVHSYFLRRHCHNRQQICCCTDDPRNTLGGSCLPTKGSHRQQAGTHRLGHPRILN